MRDQSGKNSKLGKSFPQFKFFHPSMLKFLCPFSLQSRDFALPSDLDSTAGSEWEGEDQLSGMHLMTRLTYLTVLNYSCEQGAIIDHVAKGQKSISQVQRKVILDS